MPLVLLIGGARSGKSELAVRMAAARAGPVVFIATAETVDEEMAERIARHQSRRPGEWATVEEPVDLARALEDAPRDAVVVVDCLTLWVNNLMLKELDDREIEQRAEQAAVAAALRPADTIVVTNEVGSGIHPRSALGRRFRDLLGRVNTLWADSANASFLVVAGRLLPLQDAHSLIGEEGA